MAARARDAVGQVAHAVDDTGIGRRFSPSRSRAQMGRKIKGAGEGEARRGRGEAEANVGRFEQT